MMVWARPDRQGTTLIRKLRICATPNQMRRALFEFDKLIRSLYTNR
jgi:hypothetical protein